MLKKLIIILILSLTILAGEVVIAAAPPVNCFGLPGCTQGSITSPSDQGTNTPDSKVTTGVSTLISTIIQYVAVVAVLSLMVAGIMYLLSGGEEEKLNKSKKMIIWSLTGVILSISAWMIINLINDIDIL